VLYKTILKILFLFSISLSVFADPPTQVARLSLTTGTVSLLAAGMEDWVQATLNRPLTTSDKLWVNSDGQAELQLAGATLWVGKETALSILNLDDRNSQFQVTQGRVNVLIKKMDPNQNFEIDTPNLALTIRQAGFYRLDIEPDTHSTLVSVYDGLAEAHGENASYQINSTQAYLFTGADISNYQNMTQSPDDLDSASLNRLKILESSVNNTYVSKQVIGFEDLYQYGDWQEVPPYGAIWCPSEVSSDWAPYQNGSWVWIDPWGWTWVDEAPWGFAPFHYGRWVNLEEAWCWVPGPASNSSLYAPALVEFLNFEDGDMGWFPLAPGEAYWPPYDTSQGYFIDMNSNLGLPVPLLITYYNSGINIENFHHFRHRRGFSKVDRKTFVNSERVAKALKTIDPKNISKNMIKTTAAISPSSRSVHGNTEKASSVPPKSSLTRPTIAKKAPPITTLVPFSAKQEQLTKNPGKPLTNQQFQQIKSISAPISTAPNIKTIVPSVPKQPTVKPAQVAPRPAPIPQVTPRPAPVPQVAPRPAPIPQVAPRPAPVPQVAPRPAPTPHVEPTPAPSPSTTKHKKGDN